MINGENVVGGPEKESGCTTLEGYKKIIVPVFMTGNVFKAYYIH